MDEMATGNETDEAITLSEVLSHRDSYLSEEELWALCQESCLLLEFVHNSPDMFQTLCITPDTVAFDGSGNVCFLDLDLGEYSNLLLNIFVDENVYIYVIYMFYICFVTLPPETYFSRLVRVSFLGRLGSPFTIICPSMILRGHVKGTFSIDQNKTKINISDMYAEVCAFST